MRTNARKDGDSWVLNGAKAWITNGSIADVAVVWAKAEGTIRGFLVEKGTPGFSTAYHMGKFSLRASITSQLFFEDCRIPLENVLPETNGLKYPLGCLTQARYGIAWGVLGAAMAVYNTALDYTKSRIQFGGQPIASHQLVQNKLAWMVTEITKGQLLALQAGRMKEQGKLKPQHVSMAKMNNCNIALECARIARDMLGANGVSDEYPVIRHMMNLESVKTYEGTHDIHNLIIGHTVTGIPAYNPPMPNKLEQELSAAAEAAHEAATAGK
jgi:glutaryl-CoA dehydrogenase